MATDCRTTKARLVHEFLHKFILHTINVARASRQKPSGIYLSSLPSPLRAYYLPIASHAKLLSAHVTSLSLSFISPLATGAWTLEGKSPVFVPFTIQTSNQKTFCLCLASLSFSFFLLECPNPLRCAKQITAIPKSQRCAAFIVFAVGLVRR